MAQSPEVRGARLFRVIHHDESPLSRSGWVGLGLILVAIHVIILALSPRFAYGVLPVLDRPTGTIVVLMILAGIAYLAALWWLKLPVRPPRR